MKARYNRSKLFFSKLDAYLAFFVLLGIVFLTSLTPVGKDFKSVSNTDTFLDAKDQELISELTLEQKEIETASSIITYSNSWNMAPGTGGTLSGWYITIGGRNINIYPSDIANGQLVTLDSAVSNYRKMYYGHNSGSVFGILAALPEGTIFSITENNVTTNYTIAYKRILTKEEANSLRRQIYVAHLDGSYSISLMTCAGTNLGNGDATHRLVIEANQI